MLLTLKQIEPPSEALAELSRAALRELARMLRGSEETVTIVPEGDSGGGRIVVPREAFALFVDLLAQLSNGNGVALLPLHAELTTQQAADMLNVSRPYLIRLLEERKIPCHKTGTHRRIRLTDLMEYRRRDDEARSRAMNELTAMAEEDGFE